MIKAQKDLSVAQLPAAQLGGLTNGRAALFTRKRATATTAHYSPIGLAKFLKPKADRVAGTADFCCLHDTRILELAQQDGVFKGARRFFHVGLETAHKLRGAGTDLAHEQRE